MGENAGAYTPIQSINIESSIPWAGRRAILLTVVKSNDIKRNRGDAEHHKGWICEEWIGLSINRNEVTVLTYHGNVSDKWFDLKKSHYINDNNVF